VLAIPLLRLGELAGVLYLENNQSAGAFTPDRVEILKLLSSQAAISLENARLYESLERKVAERTEKLEKLQQVAVASAHHAGMAEIATGVLHNIGNALTSVVVACGELERGVHASKVRSLTKIAALLHEHRDDLAAFFSTDDKGPMLADYLGVVSRTLEAENASAAAEIVKLRDRIGLISEVIADQQAYATGKFLTEAVDLSQLVTSVLQMRAQSLGAHRIRVDTQFQPLDQVLVHKTKLLHVLINLIKNAEESMRAMPPEGRTITIAIGRDAGRHPFVSVRDAGEGIAPENLAMVFSHGFTTKSTGHGFGLHTCANSMVEMDGRIDVASEGPGRGATFTLTFDVSDAQERPVPAARPATVSAATPR
jgi:C4-dicarboxylate-specific signal transduction histidine kinase